MKHSDPAAAARIHPNHSQRLCRALEVYRVSGVTLTEWHARQKSAIPTRVGAADPFDVYRIVQLAVCPADRAVLHQRIARRFELMMAAGFLEEVRQLRQRQDLHPDLPAIRAVGYRQLWQHLAGECVLEEAMIKGIAATRQLAKRQLTWLRKWSDLGWIYTDSAGNLSQQSLSDTAVGLAGQKPIDLALNYLDRPPL
jgi:tRNA dimethylallyltransferase